MCSIAGFSLSEKSKVQPRRLAKALLIEMDVRGNQASGYAWQSSTGSGVYKKDVAGAQISMKSMSKGARVAVLHTRYATHGSIKVMENNHPVLSPDREIALVHNGVIYNHNTVRAELSNKLPEVDSSVIPALLQEFDRDTDRFEMLDGDAAVAWLDETDRLTLKVARISHSPLCIAQLADGSFVFASTETILWEALRSLKIDPVFFEVVPERSLLTVLNGRLNAVDVLPALNPKYEEFSQFNYSTSYYRNLTSGNKSSTSSYSAPKSAEASAEVFYSNGVEGSYPVIGGRAYPTQWGEVFVPEEWFEETADDEVVFENGYPAIAGYSVNEYGEYFEDDSGVYVGSYDDFVVMGYRPRAGKISRDWWLGDDWD